MNTLACPYCGVFRIDWDRLANTVRYQLKYKKVPVRPVVDYFNGPDYNASPDGRDHPIHLTQEERSALLAFLRIL